MHYTQKYKSPLGEILLASDGENLIGLWFDGQKYFAETLDELHAEKSLPIFEQTMAWLDIYFSGSESHFLPPIKFCATPFRKSVWEILLTIPFGKTTTYGAIANRLKTSARAVGNAVGHNPISIVIPCHRVIGADGKLTGYAGGVDKKIKLLELEKFCGV